jgi:hypothetical protein
LEKHLPIAYSGVSPALPVYEQPICPAEGHIWTPGYWAYDYQDADYYWVPGTWVMAPQVGFLWTPAYWGGVSSQDEYVQDAKETTEQTNRNGCH